MQYFIVFWISPLPTVGWSLLKLCYMATSDSRWCSTRQCDQLVVNAAVTLGSCLPDLFSSLLVTEVESTHASQATAAPSGAKVAQALCCSCKMWGMLVTAGWLAFAIAQSLSSAPPTAPLALAYTAIALHALLVLAMAAYFRYTFRRVQAVREDKAMAMKRHEEQKQAKPADDQDAQLQVSLPAELKTSAWADLSFAQAKRLPKVNQTSLR